MAYNPNYGNIYPNPYSTQNIYNPYQQGYYNPNPNINQNQQMPNNINQQQQNPQQNTGFVRVQSEEEARRYPVAPGGSVTFIDENAPYCYTKSVDFSQLDRPIFKRFRLVEETAESKNKETDTTKNEKDEYIKQSDFKNMIDKYATISDLKDLESKYTDLKFYIDKMKEEMENLSEIKITKSNCKSKKENEK